MEYNVAMYVWYYTFYKTLGIYNFPK
jgi:hypothetical protein